MKLYLIFKKLIKKSLNKDHEQSKLSSKENVVNSPSEDNIKEEPSIIRAKAKKLDGPTIISSEKIDLSKFKKPEKMPVASSSAKLEGKKKKKKSFDKT